MPNINQVRRIALLAVVLLAVVLLTTPMFPMSVGNAAPADQISLSSDVEQLSIRPCLPEKPRIGITNNGSKSRFVDMYVDAEPPLRSSKPNVTTYVPAGQTVYVKVQISAPIDATAGSYDVTFDTEFGAPLVIPSTVETSPDIRCLPRENMSATATSAQVSPDYGPHLAIDGTDSTLWHTRYSPVRDVLPQSITLDLGANHDVAELVYVPRTSGGLNGTITKYVAYGSADGQSFDPIAEGTWAADQTRKSLTLDATGVRHIRLEAIEGYGGYASAAELVVFVRTTS